MYAISANRIFGPYLFEESLNQHNYLKMLKSFYSPKLQRTTDYRKYYFQQNGTAPYTANMALECLGDHLSTYLGDYLGDHLSKNSSIRKSGLHDHLT